MSSYLIISLIYLWDEQWHYSTDYYLSLTTNQLLSQMTNQMSEFIGESVEWPVNRSVNQSANVYSMKLNVGESIGQCFDLSVIQSFVDSLACVVLDLFQPSRSNWCSSLFTWGATLRHFYWCFGSPRLTWTIKNFFRMIMTSLYWTKAPLNWIKKESKILYFTIYCATYPRFLSQKWEQTFG